MSNFRFPTDPTSFRLAVADLLNEMAAKTRDARFTVAAGIVAGERNGRRRMPDELAVEQMVQMIETGEAKNPYDAARRVAKSLPSTHNLNSAIDRLRGKYRKRLGHNI